MQNRVFLPLHKFFIRLGRTRMFIISTLLMLALGGLDYLTGFEISFSFFYLIPILLSTLYVGLRYGMLVTVSSMFIWASSNLLAGETYSSSFILVWNITIRLITFSGITYLVHYLNISFEHENLLARTDFLTGINNTREFYRLADIELERARRFRQSFSIVYMDLDNFKQINDHFGHTAGDNLLRLLAQAIVAVTRKGDLFARIGGDEFVLLLPNTNGQNIHTVVEKIRGAVARDFLANQLEVTVSMGVVTFSTPPASVDELIRSADGMMYQVKTGGKNGVIYKSFSA